jgi:hypothetical protein
VPVGLLNKLFCPVVVPGILVFELAFPNRPPPVVDPEGAVAVGGLTR